MKEDQKYVLNFVKIFFINQKFSYFNDCNFFDLKNLQNLPPNRGKIFSFGKNPQNIRVALIQRYRLPAAQNKLNLITVIGISGFF